MVDDGSAPPLPRRTPGDSGWAIPEPVTAVSLPEPVVQRILAALDVAGQQPSPHDQATLAEAITPNPAVLPEPLDSAEPPAPDHALNSTQTAREDPSCRHSPRQRRSRPR